MLRTSLRVLPIVALGAVVFAAGCASVTEDEGGAASDSQAIMNGKPVLPNWATEEELAIESRSAPPDPRANTTPPAKGFRVPAEYEPVSTVIMTWAGHPAVLRGISQASAAAGADVWMVGGPATMPGVAKDRYKSLGLGFNSIWSRDYGPVGINDETGALAIVDTTYRHFAVRVDDDAMSCELAGVLEADCHTTSLILDGGNYMSDGKGNVFVTKRVYDWNRAIAPAKVDELLKTYLHANTLHVLDYAKNAAGQPADGTGHMDMFAKLVGACKVLVVETTAAPYKAVTDAAAAYFANLPCGEGNYQVTRVKGWLNGRTWYTYSNSLIVNKSVIIPFYNDTAKNEEAVATYKSVLPDYTIVGVLSESTIVQGGSIHCITKEIPALTSR